MLGIDFGWGTMMDIFGVWVFVEGVCVCVALPFHHLNTHCSQAQNREFDEHVLREQVVDAVKQFKVRLHRLFRNVRMQHYAI